MLKLKKIGVLKMALFSGLFSFFIGFISAILMWILMGILSGYMMSGIEGTGGFISIGFSMMNLIIFPFVYGIIGFIAGLIFTPIMNLIFKIIKGLDILIEECEA